jgi:Na+/proline symporter
MFWWKLNGFAAATYVGAASLIGFEALALVLGFTTAWPIAIPIVVAILALLFYAQRFFRSIFQPRRVKLTVVDHGPDGPQD